MLRRASVLALAVSIVPAAALIAGDGAVAPLNEPLLAANFQQATPSAAELLRQGVEQFQRKEYEEAVATLQQVAGDSLGAADKEVLNATLTQAQAAADQRKAARAAFAQGEAALQGGDPAAAIVQYRVAAGNAFADAGTAAKAREQMAVAEADLRARGLPMPPENAAPAAVPAAPVDPAQQARAREVYDAGRAAYDRGDTAGAKVAFAEATALGFQAGTFDTPPQKYLEMIERKEQLDALRAARESIAELRRAQTPAVEPAQPVEQPPAVAPVVVAPVVVDQQQPAQPPAVEPAQVEPAQGEPAQVEPPQGEQPAQPPAVEPAQGEQPPAVEPAQPTDQPPAVEAAPRQDLAAAAQAERLLQIQKQIQARQLVEQADAAAAGSRLQDAVRLYDQALELDPANERAQSGKRDVLALQGNNPVQEPLIDQFAREVQASKERVNFLFRTNLNIAQEAINTGQFPTAEAAIQNATVAAESNPTIFTAEELQFFRNQIAATRTTLEQTRQAALAESLRRQQADAATAAVERARQAELQRAETLAQLTRDGRRFTEQGQYEEALKVVDQILAIDRNSDYARGVRPLLQDKIQLGRQKAYREQWRLNTVDQFIEAEEKKIPYSDILRYPADWPDLSERRERSVEKERGGTTDDAEAAALLDRQLPELRFDQIPFADVIEFLRDSTQANIFVNWRALEASAIDRNTPITTRLRNVKFSKVLRTILDDVGGGTVKLGYTIDEGVITISTLEDLAQNVDIRVYDIRDLIINVPDFSNAPDFNIGDSGGGGGGGGGIGGGGGNRGGGGGGGGLFGGGGGGGNSGNDDEDEGPTRTELIEQIVLLIQDTVAPDTWRDNGGTIGSVRDLGGQLIVTQTPENQGAVAALLEKLRETRAIQVNIEARFLSVARNFLEDVGVDFDFAFNYDDNPYQLPLLPGANGLPQPIPGQTGFAPITVNQNSLNFTQSNTLETGIPGNLSNSFTSPNLSTTLNVFLDNFQASLLIRASQGARNVTTLTAPRVTLFNGQRAYVFVGTQRSYVSDLEPIVGQGSVGFNPIIDTLETGVVLDVQATVSSDRKYVTLTLRPQLNRLIELQTFPVFGGTVFGDGGTGGGGGTGEPVSGVGFIQQPVIEITEVRTTVSVPDGGTLLLGGQTLAGEIEREAGVPMVSKVPFLKRLFTNRSMAKDESVLLILVKPTIIIQREIEESSFPGLNAP
jgi:general secretion pathway protein D